MDFRGGAILAGADFCGARLTGAAIGHGYIDRHIRFEGAECDHVFQDEAGRDRQPESGDFRAGQFEKRYQEIAHTVDFLIENPAPMNALSRSLAKARA